MTEKANLIGNWKKKLKKQPREQGVSRRSIVIYWCSLLRRGCWIWGMLKEEENFLFNTSGKGLGGLA